MSATDSAPAAIDSRRELQLAALRLDLIELAFVLDRRGQCEAADVANLVVARLQEMGVAPIASP